VLKFNFPKLGLGKEEGFETDSHAGRGRGNAIKLSIKVVKNFRSLLYCASVIYDLDETSEVSFLNLMALGAWEGLYNNTLCYQK